MSTKDYIPRRAILQQRKRKRRQVFIISCLLFIVLCGTGIAAKYGFQLYSAWDKMYEEREPIDEKEKATAALDSKLRPFSVLLLGVDNRDGQFYGRSDVIMLIVVDPKQEHISLLSIPRDTYTQIIGKGRYEKINHAYAYGLKTALATVETFLDIPINYYVVVNFDGFVDFIDLLGGLEIDVERDVYYQYESDGDTSIYVEKGEQVLTGEEALLYVRFRNDVEADFGRMRRQQQVVQSILDQTLNLRTLAKLGEIIDVIGENVRTNIPASEIFRLSRQLASISGDNVEIIPMESEARIKDGIWYVFVDEEEIQRVQQELKERLNLEVMIESVGRDRTNENF
ncbi:cell envelope-related transcriptional attenuator [Caldalkalibacillus thermarum TA2.A1]|uniref:Cell envelope-related transcriptional attenuator n=1 Tax=Caldalkalibacillus thermarum (strain TA2.A1) TaxID=986075 RepID=F5L9A5_CALTT|nr:LCP family protein [Caldalkalibacillus thermarum]EGL82047.1 cell envelope-related transcriptional attenuator [Caldalkalibacillus thermarum TA2.A1]QZT34035.1 LCP family protein [Caldalkalibacillus thermarum TA2.A1]